MATIRYKGEDGKWYKVVSGGGETVPVVQTTGQSTTDVMSQKAVTDELTQRPIVSANPGAGTETLSTLKIGETTYTVASGGDPYILPVATTDKLGGVKSSTTGTTANRDYNVEVKTDGTMKVNVPWTDTVTDTSKFAKLDEENTFTQKQHLPMEGMTVGTIGGNSPAAEYDYCSITGYDPTTKTSTRFYLPLEMWKSMDNVLALQKDIPDTSNLSSFSVEVW